MITVEYSAILLVLLAVFLGAILTLAGMTLGALVVFRTKREPHEPLFKVKNETGDAFVLDDMDDGIEGRAVGGKESKKDHFDPFPPHVREAHERLMVQQVQKRGQGVNPRTWDLVFCKVENDNPDIGIILDVIKDIGFNTRPVSIIELDKEMDSLPAEARFCSKELLVAGVEEFVCPKIGIPAQDFISTISGEKLNATRSFR